ncbi:MAG: CapA family protein [Deltaproteobacteria bacterium]|nr:CapA family protein [Deltaproteobacteria bacterium]
MRTRPQPHRSTARAARLACALVALGGCGSMPGGPEAEPGDDFDPHRGSEVVIEDLPRTAPERVAPIVIRAVGDVMPGSSWPDGRDLPPPDARPAGILTPLAPLIAEADLAFANLEGAVLDVDEPNARPKCQPTVKGCFAFRMPPQTVDQLVAAGFDLISIANNHILDFGPAGQAATQRHLERAGLAYSGPVGTVARREVRGTRVAMVAMSVYDHSYDLNRLDDATAAIRAAAADSDIVIVSMHAGGEGPEYMHVADKAEYFLGRNRGDLKRFAHAAIDAGADLILGHGPHVPRAIELYGGRLIAYSLGNFATYQRFNLTGPAGIAFVLEVALDRDGAFLSGQVHPIRQVAPGGPLPDPSGAVLPILRRLSREDFPETGVAIDDAGGLHVRGATGAAPPSTDPSAGIAAASEAQTGPATASDELAPPKGAPLLDAVHPTLRARVLELHRRAAARGIGFRVVHGHARYERRTRMGPGGMANWHQFGLAADILLNERKDLGDARRHFDEDRAKWQELGAMAAELGLVWGGIWRSYDPFHLEWHPGDDAVISATDLARFLRLAGADGRNYQAVWSLYPAETEKR